MKTHRLLISFACLAVRVYGGLPMALPVEPAATEQPQVSVQAPAANPTPANDGPLLPNTKPAKKAPARWRGEMIDPQPATDDIIRLSSGDGVAGRLLRLTDTGVEWQLQLPVINKPIHFRSTGIHSIQLAAAADKAAGPALGRAPDQRRLVGWRRLDLGCNAGGSDHGNRPPSGAARLRSRTAAQWRWRNAAILGAPKPLATDPG